MKTAVEYYNQEIKELFNMHQDGEISGKMFHMSRLVALTKAKEMEKAEKIKAQIDFIVNEMDNLNWDIRKIYVEELEQQLKKLEDESK